MEKKCAIIIQARMGSGRFPNKMIAELGDLPLVEFVYRRCAMSGIKNIIVATSDHSSDDILYDYCNRKGIPAMRGSLDNVLDRYIKAGELLGAEYIVRVCGDTPFVDTFLIDKLIGELVKKRLDYVFLNKTTCASCFHSEAVRMKALKKTAKSTASIEDKEHVTRFIRNNKDEFSTGCIDTDLNPKFASRLRLTIDYPEDIRRANMIVDKLPDRFSFTSRQILDIVKKKGIS